MLNIIDIQIIGREIRHPSFYSNQKKESIERKSFDLTAFLVLLTVSIEKPIRDQR